MSEYISQEKERNNKIFLNLVKYAWKVMLIVIMLIMVIKVYSFWKDRRMYGVFYISGMTTSRIGGSIWLENILLSFVHLQLPVLFCGMDALLWHELIRGHMAH